MQARPARRLPQRTCIACRAVGGKAGLVRIVRLPSGEVEVDPTGKKPGRGSYLHANPACWAEALKKGRVDTALRVRLTAEQRLLLGEHATRLSGTSTD
jgi:predicted RNA-binding protein YlxR (DUF448 family)